MTNEEKQLLLKDLCERLPYGVICNTEDGNGILISIECSYGEDLAYVDFGHAEAEEYDLNEDDMVKPYLRPMSNMTKKEVVEYLSVCNNDYKDALTTPMYSGVDWLNAHHFDYRGLIKMGLALEAEKGMYKTE